MKRPSPTVVSLRALAALEVLRLRDLREPTHEDLLAAVRAVHQIEKVFSPIDPPTVSPRTRLQVEQFRAWLAAEWLCGRLPTAEQMQDARDRCAKL